MEGGGLALVSTCSRMWRCCDFCCLLLLLLSLRHLASSLTCRRAGSLDDGGAATPPGCCTATHPGRRASVLRLLLGLKGSWTRRRKKQLWSKTVESGKWDAVAGGTKESAIVNSSKRTANWSRMFMVTRRRCHCAKSNQFVTSLLLGRHVGMPLTFGIVVLFIITRKNDRRDADRRVVQPLHGKRDL